MAVTSEASASTIVPYLALACASFGAAFGLYALTH
jgi:hypothetical protein